ncbi:MAG: S1 RNA-binding domain-containing protein [Candidatus Shikimatogenerans sp. Ttur]|uniref:S1 RNA-binding domain-containing protein n=1 Tax=Candidatus Shikimatogenerans sp. Ttur TaxID=3158569 RepID=A0AAU7ZYD3_9FLAO
MINKKFKIGQKIICHIYKLYDYGIITIIKKYNIKCLIYLSELNWLLQLTKPKKIFKIGEKIKCLIIDINYFDTKLILSVKRLYKNP